MHSDKVYAYNAVPVTNSNNEHTTVVRKPDYSSVSLPLGIRSTTSFAELFGSSPVDRE